MFRGSLIATCVALAFCAVGAFAQSPEPDAEPLMGSEAAPGVVPVVAMAGDAALEPGAGFGGLDGVYRILVIGDGLSGGFGAGMTRMVETDGRFEIVNRFNELSGLSRPELYDWTQAAPKILFTKSFDAVLVHVGLNDRQPMRDGVERHAFKSQAWERAYRKQVVALVDSLRALNTRVFWVAVPPMAEQALDADMQYLNAIYRNEVTARGGTFIDLRANLTSITGQFTDRGRDEKGVEGRLRSRDGITFLRQGNNRVGQLLVAAIKLEESRAQVSPDAKVDAAAPVITAKAPTPPQNVGITVSLDVGLPQFGQQGLDGEEMAFTPLPQTDVSVVKPAVATDVVVKPEPLERKAIAAAPGSAAEALFTTGLSPEAELGRFDDFGILAAP